MATTYEDIYNKFESIATDSTLDSLPTNLYYYALWLYLVYAIAEFKQTCYKNLDSRTDFSQEIDTFTGDGIETEYTLTYTPIVAGTFYVSVDDVETTEYTYDSVTNKITFNNAPAGQSDIYIASYLIGTFTITLNDEEQYILAEGMGISLINKNILVTKQLSQMVYGNSLGIHSQANHNKTNNMTLDLKYRRFKQRIIEYSYQNDSDDLEDLVGEP